MRCTKIYSLRLRLKHHWKSQEVQAVRPTLGGCRTEHAQQLKTGISCTLMSVWCSRQIHPSPRITYPCSCKLVTGFSLEMIAQLLSCLQNQPTPMVRFISAGVKSYILTSRAKTCRHGNSSHFTGLALRFTCMKMGLDKDAEGKGKRKSDMA